MYCTNCGDRHYPTPSRLIPTSSCNRVNSDRVIGSTATLFGLISDCLDNWPLSLHLQLWLESTVADYTPAVNFNLYYCPTFKVTILTHHHSSPLHLLQSFGHFKTSSDTSSQFFFSSLHICHDILKSDSVVGSRDCRGPRWANSKWW